MNAKVVSIVNLKGGVGKSTLTMMLGEYLSFRFSQNVLLIDMDAQANLSYCMVPETSLQEQERYRRTTYDLLKSALQNRKVDVRQFITQPPLVVSNVARGSMTRYGTSLHMIVSTPSVAQLDQDLLDLWEQKVPMPARLKFALAEALEPALNDYDYVLIDCPPGLSVFSSEALIASRYFVCPIIPEPLSLQGVSLVKQRATELRETEVQFRGVILNIVKHFRNTHRRTAEEVYSARSTFFEPFTFWLPDSELLRKLGEFDPDVQGPWAMNTPQKFPSLHAKYGSGNALRNPPAGALALAAVGGAAEYRLDERIASLAEEFMSRCP